MVGVRELRSRLPSFVKEHRERRRFTAKGDHVFRLRTRNSDVNDDDDDDDDGGCGAA